MELNGHVIAIQSNLYDFLNRLKSYPDHLPLWVDALCINQNDEDEKSRQVALMGNIYHNAESVLVWLGKEAQGSGNLFRLLKGQSALQLMNVQPSTRPVYAELDLLVSRRVSSMDASLRLQAVSMVKHLLRSEAARNLLKRTYWTRAWIIQELVLARKILLFCGEQNADFRDIESLFLRPNMFGNSVLGNICLHRTARRNANSKDNDLNNLMKEIPPRDLTLENSTGWLPYLMESFQDTQCSRKHDKVYSLLGLCHFYKDGTYAVTPDYRITPVQLFFKAFNSFIMARNCRYAEVLRRALGLKWEDLLASNPVHDDGLCQQDTETTVWWDTSWGAAITAFSEASSRTREHERWQRFDTDYIERHKKFSWFDENLERHSLETEGLTMAPIKNGDFVFGLAGTRLAVISNERAGVSQVVGIALMAHAPVRLIDMIPHSTYGEVLRPEF